MLLLYQFSNSCSQPPNSCPQVTTLSLSNNADIFAELASPTCTGTQVLCFAAAGMWLFDPRPLPQLRLFFTAASDSTQPASFRRRNLCPERSENSRLTSDRSCQQFPSRAIARTMPIFSRRISNLASR